MSNIDFDAIADRCYERGREAGLREAAAEIERLEAYGKLQREAFEAEVRNNSRHTVEIERLRKELIGCLLSTEQWQNSRAATIEECAQIVDSFPDSLLQTHAGGPVTRYIISVKSIAAAIRALKEQK